MMIELQKFINELKASKSYAWDKKQEHIKDENKETMQRWDSKYGAYDFVISRLEKILSNAEANNDLPPQLIKANVMRRIDYLLDTAETGVEGCTYGDTDYDSPSVCFGFKQGLEIARKTIDQYGA